MLNVMGMTCNVGGSRLAGMRGFMEFLLLFGTYAKVSLVEGRILDPPFSEGG